MESQSVDHSRDIEAQPLISSTTSGPSIFTVPNSTWETGYYNPLTAFVGPYHHCSCQNKEEIKRSYSDAFIRRTGMSFDNVCLEIQKNEEEIRKCYHDDVELNRDQFGEMMVFDGTFILEFLIKLLQRDRPTQSHEADFCYDFLILNNQLPMMVLENLFSLARNTGTSLSAISLHLLKIFNSGSTEQDGRVVSPKHFIDLARYCLLPRSIRLGTEQQTTKQVALGCSAIELWLDGVDIKVAGEGRSLLDISFKGRTLTMPRVVIDRSTVAHLRNIMFFERYYYLDSTFVAAYFIMLKSLIATEEDAKMLMRDKIIGCKVGDAKDAVTIIKSLGTEFHLGGTYPTLVSVCEDLNGFHADPDNRSKARIWRQYFSTPWKRAAIIVALVVLILYYFVL